MNTYSKFLPNVFLAKCPEQHEKGDTISVSTKFGKENECHVHNLILEKDGFFYYSIIRADGFNSQARANNKVEKLDGYANNANAKSNDYYNKSNQHKDFLSLAEPIKVGHHSEKRHRKIIEQANNDMRRSVELSDKAEQYEGKKEYWEHKATEVNLSMPESIEYYQEKLEAAKDLHEGLRSGKYERAHSFSLTYAKKSVNDCEHNLKWAKKLWG